MTKYMSEQEKQQRVLSDEYLNWLEQFIHRVKKIHDEPNVLKYINDITQEDKENIFLISKLYYASSVCYEYMNLEFDVKDTTCFTQVVKVNVSKYTTVEITLWRCPSAVVSVSLIETGTGKIDIDEVKRCNNGK